MRTSVDTNIISALWSQETVAPLVSSLLKEAKAAGGVVISGPVFSELRAHPLAKEGLIEEFCTNTGLTIDFVVDEKVWRMAADAFSAYAARRRRSRSVPKRILMDFIIGAHAAATSDRLMTLDKDRYRTAFPTLKLFP